MRNKQIPASTVEGLPAGHDDTASPFYVPESARPYWANATSLVPFGESKRQMVERLAHDRAWDAAASELEYTPHPDRFEYPRAADLDNEARRAVTKRAQKIESEMLNENYGSLGQEVDHWLRLQNAEAMRSGSERTAEQSEAARTAGTCGLCGEYDHARNGDVVSRLLYPSYNEAARFVSCSSCYTVAVAEITAQRASSRLAGGKTRRDAVRDAIAQVL